jgi:oligopeptide/dipeptide ABC transporter ATP-binding protein
MPVSGVKPNSRVILGVDNLRVSLGDTRVVLVDGVSFDVNEGEVFGVVGESGSGKSLTALATIRLLPKALKAKGAIRLSGCDMLALPEAEMRNIRGAQIGMVFQEPATALNPTFRIGEQIVAAIRAHGKVNRTAARARMIELLQWVGIPEPEVRHKHYPHQFSGGMCQRIMIAIALAGGARLLIADEPTTSLDVTIQNEIVDLLIRLVKEINLSILFISHDLGLVSQICDRAAVVYAGQIVEMGEARDLISTPRHPYTQRLVACVPQLEDVGIIHRGIPGGPPLPSEWPTGCRFQPRCSQSGPGCEKPQTLTAVDENWSARCWRAHHAA